MIFIKQITNEIGKKMCKFADDKKLYNVRNVQKQTIIYP